MDTVEKALSSFYAPFNYFVSNLTSSNPWFESLPIYNITAKPFSAPGDMFSYIQATPYSMTLANYNYANSTGLRISKLVNKNGNVVSPSSAGVIAAFQAYSATISAVDKLAVDIVDAPGAASWPISSLVYMILDRNRITADCRYSQLLLPFLVWTQTNPSAVAISNVYGYATQPNKCVTSSLFACPSGTI